LPSQPKAHLNLRAIVIMGKTVLICVEEHFKVSRPAFEWSLSHVVDADDELHIVTVLPPVVYGATPVAPLATAGAVSAITNQWDAQKRLDELSAADTLKEAVQLVKDSGAKLKGVHTHAIPSTGGASGFGASLVQYAESRKVDMAILGSRGYGAVKRSLLSVVGLGSVSDYCVHNLHCPVLVVRQGCLETFSVAQPVLSQEDGAAAPAEETAASKRKICLSLDSSEHSKKMLEWALTHLIKQTDEIHVVSVAPPVTYPVLDDTAPAVCAMETKYAEEAMKETYDAAEKEARKACSVIKEHGLSLDNVWFKALYPEGGASGVGESICHYIQSNHNNMLVIGNRGEGGFKRAMSAMLGLGSVSEYCAHNAACPVIVYKN